MRRRMAAGSGPVLNPVGAGIGSSPTRSKCRTARRMCKADVTRKKRSPSASTARTAYASCAVSTRVSSTTMRSGSTPSAWAACA